MEVCREYGQPPSWFDALDQGDQTLLLADREDRIKRHNDAIRVAELRAKRGF